jgi:hypothetical protein
MFKAGAVVISITSLLLPMQSRISYLTFDRCDSIDEVLCGLICVEQFTLLRLYH